MSSNDINSPKHYKKKEDSIECIEAIEESMTPEKFQGYLKGTVMKYLWRYEDKAEPLKDLKKAQVYLDWLIRKLEGKSLFDKDVKDTENTVNETAPVFTYSDGYTVQVGDVLICSGSCYKVLEIMSDGVWCMLHSTGLLASGAFITTKTLATQGYLITRE